MRAQTCEQSHRTISFYIVSLAVALSGALLISGCAKTDPAAEKEATPPSLTASSEATLTAAVATPSAEPSTPQRPKLNSSRLIIAATPKQVRAGARSTLAVTFETRSRRPLNGWITLQVWSPKAKTWKDVEDVEVVGGKASVEVSPSSVQRYRFVFEGSARAVPTESAPITIRIAKPAPKITSSSHRDSSDSDSSELKVHLREFEMSAEQRAAMEAAVAERMAAAEAAERGFGHP